MGLNKLLSSHYIIYVFASTGLYLAIYSCQDKYGIKPTGSTELAIAPCVNVMTSKSVLNEKFRFHLILL